MSFLDGTDTERYRKLWNGNPDDLDATAARDGLSTLQVLQLLRNIANLTTTQAKTPVMNVNPAARMFHDQLMADLDELEREEASGEPAP